jgi:ParB-like chromosome segregation protein Spo0J
MVDVPQYPPLKSLHLDSSLNVVKLEKMDRLPTEALLASLLPGLKDCLKTRPDGTILDGHHRIHILRQRGIDVDILPRDVVVKEQH